MHRARTLPPQPLLVLVDNDGDEATVVVAVAGRSRRTGQTFDTVVVHVRGGSG
jgi:hypothetical protein